jgi:hypothetical protein
MKHLNPKALVRWCRQNSFSADGQAFLYNETYVPPKVLVEDMLQALLEEGLGISRDQILEWWKGAT